MRGALAIGLLAAGFAGCERTVTSDADCVAWTDTCGGCAYLCTPTWEVDDATCDLACPALEEPVPTCGESAGTCAFEE